MHDNVSPRTLSKLITRTITGIFFTAAVIGSMLLHPFAFSALFLLILVGGLVEYYRMITDAGKRPSRSAGIVTGVAAYALTALVAGQLLPNKYLILTVLSLPVLLATELLTKRPEPFQNAVYSLFGVVYITLPFAVLNYFMMPVFLTQGRYPLILLGFFLLVWVFDIFAYLTGIIAGRHKLMERISPAKTIEGLAGGLVFTLAFAFGISKFVTELTQVQWIAIALVIVLTGTLGDLSESMIKRKFNLKDSGAILPGHGGILDRFDGVFFSAPAVFCLILIWSA